MIYHRKGGKVGEKESSEDPDFCSRKEKGGSLFYISSKFASEKKESLLHYLPDFPHRGGEKKKETKLPAATDLGKKRRGGGKKTLAVAQLEFQQLNIKALVSRSLYEEREGKKKKKRPVLTLSPGGEGRKKKGQYPSAPRGAL